MSFLERAAAFGHDIELLKRGETVTTEVTINSIEQFRNLFAGDLTVEQRRAFSASNQVDSREAHPELDRSDRLILDYIYGTGSLPAAELSGPDAAFSVSVRLTSAESRTVTTDQMISTTTALNYETLTFAGGSIIIQETIPITKPSLTLTAETLIIESAPKNYKCHVGAFGANGLDASQPSPQPQFNPSSAPMGPTWMQKSPFGPMTNMYPGTGENGQTGYTGLAGPDGKDGSINPTLVVDIGRYDREGSNGPFYVGAKAGQGGAGAAGGQGGQGQNGGPGGEGYTQAGKPWDGSGGNAGPGGKGGHGGNGGQAANGGDIFVRFPTVLVSFFRDLCEGSPGGAAGGEGPPGSPGAVGQKSTNWGNNGLIPNPPNLGTGEAGTAGQGTTIKPRCHLNDWSTDRPDPSS